MKQTMIVLLSAMSVAFAATSDITEQLVWDASKNTASLAESIDLKSDVTVVLTLNWSNINPLWLQHDICTIKTNSKHLVGIGMNHSYGYNEITLIYSKSGKTEYSEQTGAYKDVPGMEVSKAALVLSAGIVQQYTLSGYLYFWNNMDEEPVFCAEVSLVPEGISSMDYTSLTLGPNGIVDKVAVYTGVTDNPLNLAEQLLGFSIPEPTTATLSLLALCGMAARRRRH